MFFAPSHLTKGLKSAILRKNSYSRCSYDANGYHIDANIGVAFLVGTDGLFRHWPCGTDCVFSEEKQKGPYGYPTASGIRGGSLFSLAPPFYLCYNKTEYWDIVTCLKKVSFSERK